MRSELSCYRCRCLASVALMLFALGLLSTASLLCRAQDTPDSPAAPGRSDVRDLREVLELVSYNPTEQGPLLVVAPRPFTAKRPLPPKERPVSSLRVVAAAASRMVVHAGSVTVLPPGRMMVITANPRKANPLAGMNVTPLFLASLTPQQWQLAGSAGGIGMGDLTPDQQLMYDTMLPNGARVATSRFEADPDDPTGHRRFWVSAGKPVPVDRSAVRLRFRLNTRYLFYGADGKANKDSDFRGAQLGDTDRSLVGDWYDPSDSADEAEEEQRELADSTAYGIRLRQKVPTRLKPSQLDYAASALDVLIPLTPELKTVQDVLTLTGQRTGLELRADQRVASLPIYLRAAPNQGARAGDLLMALAWGITGTYRHMDERVFLLTDDIEGIGTRFARFAFWALEADLKRKDIQEKALANAGRQNPLRYVKYDAETRGGLPDGLLKQVEDNWTKPGSGGYVTFPATDLPDSVRNDINRYRRDYAERKNPVNLDTSRVKISLSLEMVYILPGGSETGATGRASNNTSDLLNRMMTAGQKDAATGPDETPPSPATLNALPRSAVLVAPATVEEARTLVAAVKRCGLMEVWVLVPLKRTDPPDTAVLTAVIAAGKQAGIGVYAVVSLLRGEGAGTQEKNILGQDGNALTEETLAFYTRLYANRSDGPEALATVKRQMVNYCGWLTPDPETRAVRGKQLRTLAAIPGLAGITLRDTAGPGYTWDGVSAVNGIMGYTPGQRLAFLREKGYDPFDIPATDPRLPISTDLPFFPARSLQTRFEIPDGGGLAFVQSPWSLFRAARNREMLAAVYANLKKEYPALPLYIEDRSGSYAPTTPSWYGSWDAPDRLPRDRSWGEGIVAQMSSRGGISAARHASKTVLLLYAPTFDPVKPEDPAPFVRRVEQQAGRAAKEWDGLVVDMSDLAIGDVLRLLEGVRPRI